MPSIASVVRKFAWMKVVYWPKESSDQYGKPRFGDPVELKCRMEPKVQQIVTAEGRRVNSRGYLLLADKVVVGGLIMRGRIADWKLLPNYPALPTVNQGGAELLLVNETPPIKQGESIYEAYY